MKKLLVILLCAVLMLSFCACNIKADDTDSEPSNIVSSEGFEGEEDEFSSLGTLSEPSEGTTSSGASSQGGSSSSGASSQGGSSLSGASSQGGSSSSGASSQGGSSSSGASSQGGSSSSGTVSQDDNTSSGTTSSRIEFPILPF